ncbi:hypothetical protein AAVH_17129 [Aphelenchoides avenae]|nr:hypothetical protein AAVH_17129 [Aphelenchus avenae]
MRQPVALTIVCTTTTSIFLLMVLSKSQDEDRVYPVVAILVPVIFCAFYVMFTCSYSCIVAMTKRERRPSLSFPELRPEDDVVHIKSQQSIPSLPDYERAMKTTSQIQHTSSSGVYFEAPPSYNRSTAIDMTPPPPPSYPRHHINVF